MYAMVNIADNTVPNVNQAYMAGLMSAPMLILEFILMDSIVGPASAFKPAEPRAADLLTGDCLAPFRRVPKRDR
jgi:hypothetical protein